MSTVEDRLGPDLEELGLLRVEGGRRGGELARAQDALRRGQDRWQGHPARKSEMAWRVTWRRFILGSWRSWERLVGRLAAGGGVEGARS